MVNPFNARMSSPLDDGKIVEATAFFDTIEFTDFWNRVTPA